MPVVEDGANQAQLKVRVSINSAFSLKNINVVKEMTVFRSVCERRIVNNVETEENPCLCSALLRKLPSTVPNVCFQIHCIFD